MTLQAMTILWDGFVPWVELAASQAMLDEVHPDLPRDGNDSNTYTLGRIGQHNVVIAGLPSGTTVQVPQLRRQKICSAAFRKSDSV